MYSKIHRTPFVMKLMAQLSRKGWAEANLLQMIVRYGNSKGQALDERRKQISIFY